MTPYVIGAMVSGIVFGVISKSIATRKGYSSAMFFLGFFLGLIGLIIVNVLPDKVSDNGMKYIAKDAGNWTCAKCGRSNPPYMTSCNCGMSKSEGAVDLAQQKAQKYKEALDKGIITQEQYDKKMREL